MKKLLLLFLSFSFISLINADEELESLMIIPLNVETFTKESLYRIAWKKNPTAAAYHLILATDPDLNNPILDISDIQQTSYVLSKDLLGDSTTTYYWAITPVDHQGKNLPGSGIKSLFFYNCDESAADQMVAEGIIFSDDNGNGIKDPGEPPLRGVQVSNSDGESHISITDEYGYYKLNLKETLAGGDKIVFYANLPTGFQLNSRSFFHNATFENNKRICKDFSFIPEKNPEKKDFRFIHLTDVHVGGGGSQTVFSKTRDEIHQIFPQPDFILNSGDIVNYGNIGLQLSLFEDVLQGFEKPNFIAPGNHDVNKTGQGYYKRYIEQFGPVRYSFDYKNIHFIIFASIALTDSNVWLKEHLSLIPRDQKIIFIQHHPSGSFIKKIFNNHNVIAYLAGHMHANMIIESKGALDIVTPSSFFGGLDGSPSGYRIIDIKDDSIETKAKIGLQQQKIHLISPNQGQGSVDKIVDFLVNVYDSRFDITHVKYRVKEIHGEGEYLDLQKNGLMTWQGNMSQLLEKGKYEVAIRAIQNNQEYFEKTFTLTIGERTAPPLQRIWTQNPGGGLGFNTPIIIDNKIFIGTNDPHGLKENHIVSLDMNTGEILWKTEVDSSIKGSLAYGNNVIAGNTLSGIIYGLNSEDGTILWQRKLIESDIYRVNLYSTPVIEGNALYAGNRHRIIKLDLTSGNILWTNDEYRLPDLDFEGNYFPNYSTLVVLQDKLIFNQAQDALRFLVGIDTLTGTVVWHLNGGRNITQSSHNYSWVTASVHNNKIYTHNRHYLWAADFDARNILWTKKISENAELAQSTVLDNRVYVTTSDQKVRVLDGDTGEEIWTYQIAISPAMRDTNWNISPWSMNTAITKTGHFSGMLSSILIDGDELYFGSNDGYLYCLKKETGEFLWKYYLGSPIVSKPLISGDLLIVKALDGNIHALKKR